MLFLLRCFKNQLEEFPVQIDVGAVINIDQAVAETYRVFDDVGQHIQNEAEIHFYRYSPAFTLFMNISDVAEYRMYPLGRPMHYTILGASAM